MKKFVLAPILITMLSMAGISIAFDAVQSNSDFKSSYTGPTDVGSASPFIAIDGIGSFSDTIGFKKGHYWIVKLHIHNHGYEQFPVDPKYFNATEDNGGIKGFDPVTYFLGTQKIKPLANYTLSDNQSIDGGLAFSFENNASPTDIKYNGPAEFVINWNVTG